MEMRIENVRTNKVNCNGNGFLKKRVIKQGEEVKKHADNFVT